MRYLYILLLLSAVVLGFAACDSKPKEQENASLQAANWSDTTTLAKVIDTYYKDSVWKKDKIALLVRDPFMNSRVPNRALQLHKIYRKELKQTSPTVAYMPVLMMGLRDSTIVDFQIAWQQLNPKDSTGAFVVTDYFLQRVGDKPRYEWLKDGEYWMRKNVEAPKGKRELKMKTIDPEKLKEIQEAAAK